LEFRAVLGTFVLVFLAELGDKTQLTTMLLAAKGSPHSVFVGALLAMALSVLLGVLAGNFTTQLLPTRVIHGFAGVLFIALGGLLLVGCFRGA